MKRILSTATAAAGAVLLAVALAPGAHAASVTNPADNPHEISVVGDDGKTYTDGLDTLPGYDDYECTYIPGAWFDFGSNKVNYPDGQSIPWTEWDRATGYKTWLDNQNKPNSGGSGGGSSNPSTGGGSSTGGGKSTTTSGSKSTTSGNKSTTTGSKTSTTKTGSSSTGSDDPSNPGASTAATPGATASAGATPGATASGGAVPTDTASVGALAPGDSGDAGSTELAAAASTDSGSRGAAGIAVLAILAIGGVLIFAGRPLLARLARKGSAS